jgi:hypothetical protein
MRPAQLSWMGLGMPAFQFGVRSGGTRRFGYGGERKITSERRGVEDELWHQPAWDGSGAGWRP